MRVLSALTTASLIALSGTAQAELPPGASFGPPPIPENWELIADRHFERTLLDPYSAKRQLVRGPRFVGQGWAVCYEVNAKNAYGAYTGLHLMVLVVGPEQVMHTIDGGRHKTASRDAAKECELPPDSSSDASQQQALP